MPTEFTLSDASGNEHSYFATLHPFSEGSRISYELIRAGGPALPRLVGMVLSDAGIIDRLTQAAEALDGKVKLEDLGPMVADAAKGIDFRSAGADLESVLHALDGAGLAERILSHASRDNLKLNSPENLTAAYQGNYAEMWLAVLKIAQANRFFPVPSGSMAAKK